MDTTQKYSIPGVGLVDDPTKYGYPAGYGATPASTTPAPSPLVTRMAAQTPAPENPNAPSYLLKDVNGNIISNPGTPTVNPLRDQYRSAAQGTVDAIRSTYDKILNEDTAQKQALESKTYLRTLASGTAGSPIGATETTKASEAGQKKYQADLDEREAKVNAAFSNADLRATDAWNAEQTSYLTASGNQVKAKADLAAKVKTEAENEVAAYTGSYSYDEWAQKVGTPKVQQYMNETGLDETGLKALFLKSAKDQLIDVNGTKLSDGSVVFMKKVLDANGNIIGTKEVGRVTGTGGKKIKESRITDNGVQILYEDGTYETKGAPGNNISGTPKGFTSEDVEKGKQLFQQFGKNGFAEPAFYLEAYQNWVKTGGTAAKFKELYSPDEFINPKDAELLPTFLRPSKAAAADATPPDSSSSSAGGRAY